jgi:alpha-tubulin suppressor-like RCC1 family protein
VRKAAGGLKFTLVWADSNRLLAVGSNRFGQCGQNSFRVPEVKQLTQIGCPFEKGEEIVDIACGFCHSLVLTNKHVYFFGSIEQGQNPFACKSRSFSIQGKHMHAHHPAHQEPTQNIRGV